MRYTPALLVLLLTMMCAAPAQAQAPSGELTPTTVSERSSKRAFALSLLLPGLGHRYAQHGHWRGGATLFALADVSLWGSLIGVNWRKNNREDTFRSLAATQAGAQIEGKDREFFLNLATFRSSDEYLDVQLRNRAWDRVDYVSDRSFQWTWEDDAAFFTYRDLREEAESLDRRGSLIIATLVANRLLSGLMAVRATGRANRRATLSLSMAPPPRGTNVPVFNLQVGF